MLQRKRLRWEEPETNNLMALWGTVGSVYLISLMLRRTRSSVQTRASRIGLPPREETSDRHRRRWLDGDDRKLDDLLAELRGADDMVPILDLADRMGRSVDSVASRIEERFGEDSDTMARLSAPPMPDQAVMTSSIAAAKPATRTKEGTKACLRCRRTFWSEGSHNWVCPTCKRGDQFDFDY